MPGPAGEIPQVRPPCHGASPGRDVFPRRQTDSHHESSCETGRRHDHNVKRLALTRFLTWELYGSAWNPPIPAVTKPLICFVALLMGIGELSLLLPLGIFVLSALGLASGFPGAVVAYRKLGERGLFILG